MMALLSPKLFFGRVGSPPGKRGSVLPPLLFSSPGTPAHRQYFYIQLSTLFWPIFGLDNGVHFKEQETYWREQICLFSENRQISPPFKLTPPSLAFKNLFIAYTRAFNRATGRTGTLFERPFHRKPVDSQAYFLTLINYIHQNPQKHGLIADFRDWKWSSYGAYCSDRPSNIRREQVIAWYGGQRSFFEAHDKDLTNLQDLSNLWEP
jgi:hypothetical protein